MGHKARFRRSYHRSSGCAFCRNCQRTNGCRSWTLVEVIICSMSLIASDMLFFLYMLNYPACLLTVRKRESASYMQGTLFTSARLKIVSTIKNLNHIQCQCVDELSSSVRILQHPFLDRYQPRRSRVDPYFFPLAKNLHPFLELKNLAVFWKVFLDHHFLFKSRSYHPRTLDSPGYERTGDRPMCRIKACVAIQSFPSTSPLSAKVCPHDYNKELDSGIIVHTTSILSVLHFNTSSKSKELCMHVMN